MTKDDPKFDPSWKETPDLPGEIDDEKDRYPSAVLRVEIVMTGGTRSQRMATMNIEHLRYLLKNYPALHVLSPEERFSITVRKLELDIKSLCPSCGSDPDVDCICKG
jgi:hypothetical protein